MTPGTWKRRKKPESFTGRLADHGSSGLHSGKYFFQPIFQVIVNFLFLMGGGIAEERCDVSVIEYHDELFVVVIHDIAAALQ